MSQGRYNFYQDVKVSNYLNPVITGLVPGVPGVPGMFYIFCLLFSMDKRQQWEFIKTQAPDVADWLAEINRVFGKAGAIRIELLESDVIVESGQFDGQCIWDGKLRMRNGKR